MDQNLDSSHFFLPDLDCDDDDDGRDQSADDLSPRNESSETGSPGSQNWSLGSNHLSPPDTPSSWTNVFPEFGENSEAASQRPTEISQFGEKSEVISQRPSETFCRLAISSPQELKFPQRLQSTEAMSISRPNFDLRLTRFANNPRINPTFTRNQVIAEPRSSNQSVWARQSNSGSHGLGFQNFYPILEPTSPTQNHLPHQVMYYNQGYFGYPTPPPVYSPRFMAPNRARLPNSAFVRYQPILECKFCKNNGEAAENYQSHKLRNPIDQSLICPVLRNHVCEICGATGDNAHTRNYCPNLKKEDRLACSIPNSLKKTRRLSNGDERK